AVGRQADAVTLDDRGRRRAPHVDAGEVVEADDIARAGRAAADRGGTGAVLDDDADRVRQRLSAAGDKPDRISLNDRAAGAGLNLDSVGAAVAGDQVAQARGPASDGGVLGRRPHDHAALAVADAERADLVGADVVGNHDRAVGLFDEHAGPRIAGDGV